MTRRACSSWSNPNEPGISIRFDTQEKERIVFREGYRDSCNSQRRNHPKMTGSRSGKGRCRDGAYVPETDGMKTESERTNCSSGKGENMNTLKERTHQTRCGTIFYWADVVNPDAYTLVFLPGLTADHRLFDRQIEYFEGKYNVLVWDAPAHTSSWPFRFDFNLFDQAKWLNEILSRENICRPVIVGQSMGGYVGQAYAQLFPDKLAGFISIDSAPLAKKYVTAVERWLLKKMEPVYAHYPWKALLKAGTEGVATSAYGRRLMREMMLVYDGDQKRYARIAGHGYRILADAMERDLPYEIRCPALLLCGSRDHAGSCIRYNKKWHKNTQLPLVWIEGAGHNANTDKPEEINRLIENFLINLRPI